MLLPADQPRTIIMLLAPQVQAQHILHSMGAGVGHAVPVHRRGDMVGTVLGRPATVQIRQLKRPRHSSRVQVATPCSAWLHDMRPHSYRTHYTVECYNQASAAVEYLSTTATSSFLKRELDSVISTCILYMMLSTAIFAFHLWRSSIEIEQDRKGEPGAERVGLGQASPRPCPDWLAGCGGR